MRRNNFIALTLAIAIFTIWGLQNLNPQFFSLGSTPVYQTNKWKEFSKHPGWFEQYKIMKANENGEIPSGLLRQWHYQDLILAKKGDSTGLKNIEELGPRSVGGRTRAIMIDRTNSDHIIAGSVSGGIWQSYNGGKSWEPHNDFADNLSVSDISQSPANPDIIYYGTGEPIGNSADVPGEGVYQSLDGGKTFNPLPATLNDTFSSIWDVETAKNREDVVYVSAKNFGLYRSDDKGQSFEKIFEITGGVFGSRSYINDIETFRDSSVILGVQGQGLYKSENGEPPFNKLNTTFPNGGFGRVELAYCKSQPNVIYAVLSAPNTQEGLKGIWRSNDGGKNWQEVTNPENYNSLRYNLSWYALTVEVNPNDPDELIVGSVTAGMSSNGGQNWFRIPRSHVDYHTIVNDPNNPNQMLIGNDGGIYRYNWNTLNPVDLNEGYQVTQYYAGHYYPEGNQVVGGTQDNGTHALRNDWDTTGFQKFFGGDGAFTAINQQYPDTGYVSTQNGRIRKSTNIRSQNPTFERVYRELDENNDFTVDDSWFINPFEINPLDGSQLYFTTKEKVWITTNGAENWRKLTNPLLGTSYNTAISRSKEPSVAYIYGNSGLFYRVDLPLHSSPGDEINLRNSVPQEIDNHFIRSMKVHPEDSSIIYAGLSQFMDEPRIWKISNGLSNDPDWEPIGGDLPSELPVNTLAVDPKNPDSTIIIGTDFGLYITNNQGKNWVKEDSIPNVSIHQIRLRHSDRTLFIYTHGRGIWKADLSSFEDNKKSPKDSTGTEANKELVVFPNPVKNELQLKLPFNPKDNENAKVTLYSLRGKTIYHNNFSNEANPTLDFTGMLPGYYLLRVKTPQKTYNRKLMKQ